jgi:hypothetical protein
VTAYLKWNDALARHFFRPEFAGQPVWVFVTDDLIEELGTELNEGAVPDFVEAVKTGPPWAAPGSLCQRALHAFEGWRERGLDFPPYIGYLALFVLAAGREGNFASHAYYPRLWDLLGEPDTGRGPSSFDRMFDLWDDLESWSTADRRGDLGVFEARWRGSHIYVGLPIAQAILSEDERRALPLMFAQAGFDPTSPPPDDELARMLRTHAAAALRPRTRELVRTRRDPETYAVLLDTVAEELAGWDGTLEVLGHERYEDLLRKAGVLNEQFIDRRTRAVLRRNGEGQLVATTETTDVSVPVIDVEGEPGGAAAAVTDAGGQATAVESVEEHTARAEKQLAGLQVELARRPDVPTIAIPRLKMTPIKSEFSLADITDRDAFRKLGERIAADPVGQLRRVRLGARVIEGPDGLRRTELVTTRAIDRVESPAELLPREETRQQLVERVLNAPVVPARANQRAAVAPIIDAFMKGLGDQAEKILSGYMDRAAAGLIQLITEEQRKFAAKPSYGEVVELVEFNPTRGRRHGRAGAGPRPGGRGRDVRRPSPSGAAGAAGRRARPGVVAGWAAEGRVRVHRRRRPHHRRRTHRRSGAAGRGRGGSGRSVTPAPHAGEVVTSASRKPNRSSTRMPLLGHKPCALSPGPMPQRPFDPE